MDKPVYALFYLNALWTIEIRQPRAKEYYISSSFSIKCAQVDYDTVTRQVLVPMTKDQFIVELDNVEEK